MSTDIEKGGEQLKLHIRHKVNSLTYGSKWQRSVKGNWWQKVKGRLVIVLPNRSGTGWVYSIDGKFCRKVYLGLEQAKLAALDACD